MAGAMRTFWKGEWHEGPVLLAGPHTHAFWLGSSVFDGARIYEGVAPDLDAHAARVNASARRLGLEPMMEAETIAGLAREGAKAFGPDAALYVKPMYWAEGGAPYSTVAPGPETTAFCLHLYEAPMPGAGGASLTLSPFRRPLPETMPTDVKTGSLYPNNARAIREAHARGFSNALVRDVLGNIAETATSNAFLAKDGAVMTPAANGCFLAGITRARVISLLRGDGVEVRETTLTHADFLAADELFTCGNYGKVQPVTRIEDRELQPGPLYRRARDLYAAFAHGGG